MASIFDISRITGVSKSTVQRVLSGTGSYSADVAQKVLDTARELHYRPNGLARAMKTKQTKMIGVIVYRKHMPIISHPFYGQVLDSIASELQQHGYGILLIPDSEVSIDSGDWLMEHQVDGMVLLSQITTNLINYFKGLDIPFVLINNSEMVDGVNYIVNDDFRGSYEATEHLIRGGHQRIAFVSGPTGHRSYRLRLEGFRAGLADFRRGFHSDYIYSGDSRLETGTEAAKRFLAMKARPDAIFASNDMMAIGVLRELSAHAVSVPQDMSLVGFDDIDYASLTIPALTTVQVDKGAMGRLAVEKLIGMLNHDGSTPKGIVLPSRLMVRGTTRTRMESL